MSLAKIQEICNAHGQFSPSGNSSLEEAYDTMATTLSYFDNQVRGISDLNLESSSELATLKRVVLEQEDALARVKVMIEKFPGWVNDMARVCHEMISNLTIHHRFEHAAPPETAAEMPGSPPCTEQSAEKAGECSPESSLQPLGMLDPC